MGHLLRVTDGTTTVNLSGGPIYQRGYVPRSPNVSTVEFTAESLRDGGELFAITRRNVVETAPVVITGSTTDVMRGYVRSLEGLFCQAEARQMRGVGDRVYVEFQPGESGDIFRSELGYGRVEIGKELLTWWPEMAMEAAVVWKRRFYWEGPEVELALTNGGGSGTGGRTVYNHDDGDSGHDNYVAIDGEDVEGVIPAPMRLELRNTYDVSARAYDFLVGHNVFANPASLAHILEGEDAAYVAGGATATASGACSGGYYQTATWTGDNETMLYRFVLSASLLAACAGNYFRLLARVASNPGTGVKVKPKIKFPSGSALTVVGEAQEMTLAATSQLQDLGVLQIPPWLTGETGLYPVDLCLYGRKTGGGSVDLDFVQLTSLDSYRVLTPRGYGAPYLVTVVDDGIGGSVWADTWPSSGKAGHYIAHGQPVHLWPGRDQRLYLLVVDSGSDVVVARTASVRVYYRPRRLTL